MAAALVGRQSGTGAFTPKLRLCFLETRRGLPYAATWNATFDTPDGASWTVCLDAVTGYIPYWQRFPPSHDNDAGSALVPRIAPERAVTIALEFVEHDVDLPGRMRVRPYEDPPLECQHWYAVGWEHVLDATSGCIGPVDLGVFVDHQTGEVLGVQMPWSGPVLVPTRPVLDRRHAVEIATRYAPLDTEQYMINRTKLRLAVDEYGVQRLVWECYQLPEPGAFMFGVVVDAQSGEPLRLDVPLGAPAYPLRRVELPRRVSARVASGPMLATSLLWPHLFRTGLWVRAEHLRAVEGVRVDVDRKAVSVRLGDRVISGTELGARYRDYGWWVPLRQAARVLGWRVEWLNAKKEAAIYTR